MEKLIESMLAGQRLALARVLTKVENRDPDLPQIVKKLYPLTGRAQVWGITGPPGAGKSTLVDRLVTQLRKEDKKVAVVAIDPSSPFSGGAILGDRIRMQRHSTDEKVYIRSLGTRGKHGGLSHATKEVVMVLDAAGFDVILVETAGVGQTELDILRLAQTVLVVLVPESGDSIQVMKAGLMEIADVFAVNKSDRPEADQLVRELVAMVGMSGTAEGDWNAPILKTEGNRDIGTGELREAIASHQAYLGQNEGLKRKTARFVQTELLDILNERLNLEIKNRLESESGQQTLTRLLDRKTDPYEAANLLFPEFSKK